MPIAMNKAARVAIAASLGLAAAACQTPANQNASLDSVRQPVVERANYALDVETDGTGLPVAEQGRLVAWFDTLDLGYGDRVSLDDAAGAPAVRDDVAALAGRYGLLLSDGAPVTNGFVQPGRARIVVTRTRAHVPGCPDWSEQTTDYGNNTTHPGFGCAVNGNLAAMIADPEHLLKGAAGTGETVVMSSNKAISTYRAAAPTGAEGLPEVSSQEGGQ